MVRSVIFTGLLPLSSYLHLLVWIPPFISLGIYFNASHTRMSKRGSTALRYTLINAAHNVVKNNATFKSYYDTKTAEGRTHYNARGHCAGKLVRVIHKMLSDDVAFNLG